MHRYLFGCTVGGKKCRQDGQKTKEVKQKDAETDVKSRKRKEPKEENTRQE